MEILTGYLQTVIFSNTQSQYHVIRIRLDQKKDEKVMVVGNFELPDKHDLCRFIGEFIEHPKYGKQLKLSSLEKILPQDREAIIRFLSSALFPKVGRKTAQTIIDQLGEQCLPLIRDNPEVLLPLGLKEEIRLSIVQGLRSHHRLEEAMKIFVGYGIGMKELIKMDAVYGDQMIDIVMRDPYQLMLDIDGMGFKTVDRIALSMGIEERDERRIKATLLYVTNQICFKNQNTYTDFPSIAYEMKDYLPSIDSELLENCFAKLIESQLLIHEENRVYPRSLYVAELGIAEYLVNYLNLPGMTINPSLLESEIRHLETALNIHYSDEQIEAIYKSLSARVSIITGGPGTGKTTVIKAIISLYRKLFPDYAITLCAPTGRASKRLSELTGEEATTIHRFLAWDLDTNQFAINQYNPQQGDLLIVDEFSMVDVNLCYHLLRGTHPFKQLIFIGDEQQLPPVSPGDVLSDLLTIPEIAVTKLIKIHRQKDDSGIIPMAAAIRSHQWDNSLLNQTDVQFQTVFSGDVPQTILQKVEYLQTQGYTANDIQVLAPMYDGHAGITHLNDVLREFFNPPTITKKEVQIGRTLFREGDKILLLKNQPNDDVYNGDIGVLETIEEGATNPRLIVNFDGNEVTFSEFSTITLAYCISVHKSQGSEYPIVILPFVNEHRIMLRRKLIYTAITRAKQQLFMLGDRNAFERGIHTEDRTKRLTTLVDKIRVKLTELGKN